MIDAGVEEGVPANWGRVQQAYQAIVGQIPRTAPRQTLEAIAEELEGLWAEVREALESFVKTQKMDANESRDGCHIQNSKPDSKFESESGLGNKDEAGANGADTDNVRSLPKRELPLGIVLDACPNMLWLVKGSGGIRNWREFLAAADVARPAMASARALGRKRERQWVSSRRRLPLPRSTSGRTRSTAPAAICAA
jgi:replication initiation protein RepC